MIDSDRLKIEEIRLQEKVNSPTLLEIRSDADDAEQRIGERNALTEQLSEKRLEIIKAMEKEDLEAQAAMARDANTDGWTPELREFHQLGQRTSILEYMQAGLQQRHLRVRHAGARVQLPRLRWELERWGLPAGDAPGPW